MTTADFDGLCARAKEALRQRQFAEAADLYQEAIDLDECRAAAHEGLATACSLLGDYEEAAAHYLRATQLDPRKPRPFVNLGAIYNRLGHYQKAVETLLRGIQKDHRCADAFYNLGLAYRKLNQLGEAVSAYREAIRLAPQMADAYHNLGNALLQLNNFQQAIIHFRKALELQPDLERAARGLKRAEEAAESSKRSISPFGRLANTNGSGSSPMIHVERELTQEERIDDRDTLRDLSEAIEHAARECIEQIRGELEPAVLHLNRLIATSSDDPLAIAELNRELGSAVNRCLALRRQLTVNLDALRKHEEAMTEAPVAAES